MMSWFKSESAELRRSPAPIIFSFLLVAGLLSGCGTVPENNLLITKGETAAMTEVMARRDKIVLVSARTMDPHKPLLLLLHGATDDPTEMMGIVEESSAKYNVLLYTYNFHHRIKKVAADFAVEFEELVAKNNPPTGPGQNITVVTYSYSSTIFRKAVLLADDPALFAHVSLIQVVPTPGGSYLARGMGSSGVAWLVSLLSEPSGAENPHGRIAKELWGDEGNRKFNESIDSACVQSIVIEGDRHSVNNLNDFEIQKRYQNGIGPNVIVVPKSAGVTHEEFPAQPAARAYLRVLLGTNPAVPTLVHDQLLARRSGG